MNTTNAPAERLVSLDAYRGFVMVLMASAGLNIPRVASHFPDSGIWKFLAYQTEHAPWRGCSLWDLIQPSFMFMVGVALPFSLANRQARGQAFGCLFLHAVWRAFALVALGVFLASGGHPQTNFAFDIVLAQIGWGYAFLFLIAWTKPRTQFLIAGAILLAYWGAFALYPVPPLDLDGKKVGLPGDWEFLTGFAAHWEKNTNLATAFDQWFLNLFPREQPFAYSEGGYCTLNFVPSLATMIFGVLTGHLLRSGLSAAQKIQRLIGAGLIAFAFGLALDVTGVCPSVKRIWTPSWAIFSTGWTCLFIAAFYWVIDVRGHRSWARPLVAVGMNSIAMYCMSFLFKPFFRERLKLHLGPRWAEIFGTTYAPMVEMAAILACLWLVCWWMYRRKLFLRI